MKSSSISSKVDLEVTRLGANLGLLCYRGLVEKQEMEDGKDIYVVSGRGLSVLKVLGPIVREAKRIERENYETISNTLSDAKIPQPKINRKKRRWGLARKGVEVGKKKVERAKEIRELLRPPQK
jgi:hypothetical protein